MLLEGRDWLVGWLVGWLVLVDDQVIVRDRQTEKCHEKVSAAVAKVSIEMMIFMYIISL